VDWKVGGDIVGGLERGRLILDKCNVIINKTKVLLPQILVTIADFGYPV
jgi:hypothetical protein